MNAASTLAIASIALSNSTHSDIDADPLPALIFVGIFLVFAIVVAELIWRDIR